MHSKSFWAYGSRSGSGYRSWSARSWSMSWSVRSWSMSRSGIRFEGLSNSGSWSMSRSGCM